MKVQFTLVTSALLLTLCGFAVSYSAAQEEVDPNEQFERAGRYVRRGQLDRAIQLYTELGSQLPDWSDVWFNLGEVSRVAEQYPGCVVYLRRYLYLVPDDAERTQLEAVIDRCASDMSDSGQLEVSAQPPEARILVDGLELARGNLDPLPLTPGSHHIHVEAADFIAESQTVEVTTGEVAQVAISLDAVIHYGTLRLTCNEEGAAVTIEGDVVGATPLAEPVRLQTGNQYLVQLTKDGFYDWLRRIEIEADEETVLDVEMQELDPWDRP